MSIKVKVNKDAPDDLALNGKGLKAGQELEVSENEAYALREYAARVEPKAAAGPSENKASASEGESDKPAAKKATRKRAARK